jgi:hypothetical protein
MFSKTTHVAGMEARLDGWVGKGTYRESALSMSEKKSGLKRLA